MLIFSPNIDAPAALPSYNHRQKEKKKKLRDFTQTRPTILNYL